MVRLIGNLYIVSGASLTHPWDASAYLIAGDEPVLIDCGGTLGYEALKNNLSKVGYQPKDIKKVIGTHGHWDHLSAMAQLRNESDAELYLHADDREQVECGDFERTSGFLYDQSFPAVQVDHLLTDGQLIQLGKYEFQVIHTPGHSPGSVCFYANVEGMKFMILGDTLWGGFHERVKSNLVDWQKSLDKLEEFDFEVASWGHGAPSLIYQAKDKLVEAKQQLGVYYNPWFKPFHTKFQF